LLAAAAYPDAVRAATVDHGLRAEAAEEADLVRAACGQLGVEHQTLGPLDHPYTGNLQEQARLRRYQLLCEWAAGGEYPYPRPWKTAYVATAHHVDDVAETFLMRARRGVGVGGLAAMQAARPIHSATAPVPTLVRPLLGWKRAELEHIVAAAGVPFATDPSNFHPRFDRSRIRAVLAGTAELPAEQLARTATNLRAAEEALLWVAEREYEVRHTVEGYFDAITVNVRDLPYELRRRLAFRAIEEIRFERGPWGGWRGTGLDRLVATLDSGGTGTIAGVKASAKHAEWRFSAAPARRSH
jgi:tRNA(Ile)-lysidine synthase